MSDMDRGAAWLRRLAGEDVAIDVVRCFWISPGSGWRIEDRCHDDHILYLITGGGVRWSIAGQDQDWGPGTCAWIGPGIRHAARPLPGPATLRFGVLRVALRTAASPLAAPGPPLVLAGAGELRADLAAVIDAVALPGPHREIRVRAGLLRLFARMLELGQDARAGEGLDVDQRRRLHELIDRHWTHHPDPGDLARALGLSAAALRNAMHRTWNLSPRAWILRERMRRIADQLREDDAPIETIARRCGYASAPSFMRLFTVVMGLPPGRWRREAGRSGG